MSAARRDVERMAHTIAADVAALENATINALLPSLLEARDQLRRDLTQWLSRVDGAERFTAQQFRRALVALEAAIETIGHMRADLQTQIAAAATAGATLAADHIREELVRFSSHFGETLRPTQISTAGIIAKTQHEIIPRIRTSSARYVQVVREDIRRQFAMGLASGESFEQLTNRLRRLGGPRGLVALRGVAGEPGAQVEMITEGLFNRYRHWAERVVRTEVMNAYNVEHAAGLELINNDREEDEAPFVQRWDSSPDKRRCPRCRELDGRTAPIGGKFRGGVERPPLHPNCRCVVVAWHPSWGGLSGETPPVEDKKKRQRKPPAQKAPGELAKQPKPKKPPAANSQRRALDSLAADDLPAARVHVDDMMRKRGLSALPTTTPTAQTTAEKLPAGVLGSHRMIDGRIRLAPRIATDARKFADAYTKDPKDVRAKLKAGDAALRKQAEGLHVLVHESLHGFGPMRLGQYFGVHAQVEEIVTENLARKVMQDKFSVPRWSGAYEREIQAALGAIREHFKVGAGTAQKLLDTVTDRFKRLPQPKTDTNILSIFEQFTKTVAEVRPSTKPERNKPRKALVRADGTEATDHEYAFGRVLLHRLRP